MEVTRDVFISDLCDLEVTLTSAQWPCSLPHYTDLQFHNHDINSIILFILINAVMGCLCGYLIYKFSKIGTGPWLGKIKGGPNFQKGRLLSCKSTKSCDFKTRKYKKWGDLILHFAEVAYAWLLACPMSHQFVPRFIITVWRKFNCLNHVKNTVT